MVGDALAGWAVVAVAGATSPRALGPRAPAPSPPPRATDTPSPAAGNSAADVGSPFPHSRILWSAPWESRTIRQPRRGTAPEPGRPGLRGLPLFGWQSRVRRPCSTGKAVCGGPMQEGVIEERYRDLLAGPPPDELPPPNPENPKCASSAA